MAADLSSSLFQGLKSAPSSGTPSIKVSVIGAGNVGMAITSTILTRHLADEIALVATKPDKVRGEVLDLQHAAAFLPRTRLVSGTDMAVTKGSSLVIITAGVRQQSGESRLNLLQRNYDIFQKIVPELARQSPHAVLLIVTNPVDVMSYVAWKLSGFPAHRVIGSGTNLDSSRLRFLLAKELDMNAGNVQAYMIGEHGDSVVAIWSKVTVAGMPAHMALPGIFSDDDKLEDIRLAVVNSANEVISLKGYTSWAVGYSVANLTDSILRDQMCVHPVSVLASGFHDIAEDVFVSLPARLGRGGVHGVLKMELTEEETKKLKASAMTLWECCDALDFSEVNVEGAE